MTATKRKPKPRTVPAARDADGRTIRVGALIENLANHDDFGRVEHVIEGIVLYRQLGDANHVNGGCHRRGELCTWQNNELRVVEDPA
jgi:hypothetical protein